MRHFCINTFRFIIRCRFHCCCFCLCWFKLANTIKTRHCEIKMLNAGTLYYNPWRFVHHRTIFSLLTFFLALRLFFFINFFLKFQKANVTTNSSKFTFKTISILTLFNVWNSCELHKPYLAFLRVINDKAIFVFIFELLWKIIK